MIIFTDIDGTIIDKETYSFQESVGTLNRVLSLKIPVILVSSKSAAEIELYRQRMGISDPFVSENGGAVFIPQDYFQEQPEGSIKKNSYFVKELAIPLSSLSEKIKVFKENLKDEIIFYTDLPAEELSAISNLPLNEAVLSKKRDYDLPFIIKESSDVNDEDIHSSAGKAGLYVTKGGRYYHILSQSDKGKAVQYLKKEYSKYFDPILSVGLGDGPNDLEMLQNVD
jgi:mannosyl-3-phosphoglycerate phosphatase